MNTEEKKARRRAYMRVYWHRPKNREKRKVYRRQPRIKNQRNTYLRAYYRANKEKIRDRKKTKKHGLTLEEFNTILKAQDGKCAVCRTTDWGLVGPCVDHNHKTGEIRGILCSGCNTAEGLLKGDPIRAKALAVYMEKHNGS